MANKPARRLLDKNAAAAYLGIGLRTLERMVAGQEIPAIRFGGRGDKRQTVRFDVHDLDRWIEQHREAAKDR